MAADPVKVTVCAAALTVMCVVLISAATQFIRVVAKAGRARCALAALEARFGSLARRAGGGAHGPRAAPPRREPLRRAAAAELLRERTYDEYRREVDALVARAGALGEFGPESRLAAACRAAVAGGKRVRAVILLEVARAASLQRRAAARAARAVGRGVAEPAPADAADAALLIEYLHAASLVVDDLPAFDDDAERRGRPSLHAAVGPAVAQMAAFSLVAAALQNACRQVDWVREHCPEVRDPDRIGTRLCSEVCRALGAEGAAGGQCMDIADGAELFRDHGPGAVAELMWRKTATFFEIATVGGWLAAGGAAGHEAALRDVGRHVGTAFQIADDLGDAAEDAARRAEGKAGWNYANTYGPAAAAAAVEDHLAKAQAILERLWLFTPLWDEIYGQVRAMARPPAAPSAQIGTAS